jgi:hypothetical protein
MTATLNPVACPNCGGQVKATQSGYLTCVYCGSAWQAPRVPADRIASEYAIARLEKEIDALILSLLVEAEERERLRERINLPAPRPVAGAIVQTIGFILFTAALPWAVIGARTAVGHDQAGVVLLAALFPLSVALCVVVIGLLQSRLDRQRLSRLEQHKLRLRDLEAQSQGRSAQAEAALQEKRAQLERHKLLTSV